MGCDEPIAPTTAMLAAMKKSEQSIDRNRGAPDVRFRFVIMEVPSLSLTIRDHSHPSRFYPTTREVVNNFVPVFRAQPLSGERPRPACWRWRPRHGGLFFVLSIRSQLPCVCTHYFGATPKPRDGHDLMTWVTLFPLRSPTTGACIPRHFCSGETPFSPLKSRGLAKSKMPASRGKNEGHSPL